MSFQPPNESELAGVQRLKDRLASEHPEWKGKFNHTTLLRFYRGRKAIDEDAFKALVKHAEWRVENDVDNIANEISKFQKEMDAGKFVVEGYDLTGRPTIFIYAKKHNKNDRDLDQMRLLIIYTMETVLKRTNPAEERMVICFDLTGFKLSCMDYDMVKLLIRILEFNYPETLSTSLIINAPFMFYACWAVIRPWLDPVTAAKISFINSDKIADYITFAPPVALVSSTATNNTVSSKNNVTSSSFKSTHSISRQSHNTQCSPEVKEHFDATFDQCLGEQKPHALLVKTVPPPKKKKGYFY